MDNFKPFQFSAANLQEQALLNFKNKQKFAECLMLLMRNSNSSFDFPFGNPQPQLNGDQQPTDATIFTLASIAREDPEMYSNFIDSFNFSNVDPSHQFSCPTSELGPNVVKSEPAVNDVKRKHETQQSETESIKRNKRSKRKSEVSTLADNEDNKACNRWTEREEVFLSGLVMDVYFRRHSLKPTNSEKAEAKRKGVSCDMLIWQDIGVRYNQARERFKALTGFNTPERSIKSLQRHWKETGMKKQVDEDDEQKPVTKFRERTWDDMYNFQNILMCSDSLYNAFLADREKCLRYTTLHQSLKENSSSPSEN